MALLGHKASYSILAQHPSYDQEDASIFFLPDVSAELFHRQDGLQKQKSQ